MDLGKAKLDVIVDSSGARSGVDAANRAFEQLRNKGEQATKGLFDSFSKLKDKIFSIQGVIAGLGVGLLAKSFIDAGKQTENMTVRLQVLLGSVSEGKRLFKEMNEYAARTPFEFNEVMNSATNLAAVLKGGVDEVKGYMPLIADLSAAAGIGIEQATQNVVKMLSAGSAAADMFRERGILAMLGFQQGVKYSAEETRKILIEAWESPTSKFRDAAKLLVTTWDGAMSNLADSWFQFQQRVMIDGGVLDYLKAVVQVIAGNLTDSFGAPTGKAEALGKNLIEMGRSGVRALGAIAEAGKFVGVIFEAIKGSIAGINTLFAASTANGAEMAAKFRQIQTNMARDALADAEYGGSEARIEEARKRLREALVSEQQAWQNASKAQNEYITASEDNTAQMERLFAAYQSFEEGVNFDKFLDEVNKRFEENKKASEGATNNLSEFNSGLLDFVGPAGTSQKEMKELAKSTEEFSDRVDDLVKKYDEVGQAELTRSQSLGLLSQAVFAGKISGEAYHRILAAINEEYSESIEKSDEWSESLESIKERYIDGYSASKDYREALEEIQKLHAEGKLVGPEYAAAIAGVTKEYKEATQGATQLSKETQAYLQIMQSAHSQLESSFNNFFVSIFDDGTKAFEDLGDSILDMFKQMLADMATMAIVNPIIVPIVQQAGNWLGGLFGQQGAGNIYAQAFSSMLGGGQQSGSVAGAIAGGAQSGGFTNSLTNMATSYLGDYAQSYLGSLFGGASAAYAGLGAAGAGAGVLAGGTYAAAGAAPWVSAASGTAAWTTGVSSSVTGMGAASGAVTSGAAASGGMMATLMAAMPYIALILFGISKGDAWFQEGWRMDNPMNSDIGGGPWDAPRNGIGGNTMADWTTNATASILEGIFDDRTAAALSGSVGTARAWGYRNPSIRDRDDAQGFDWNFGPEGASGNLWAQIKAKGGWFVGDKKWTETADLDPEMLEQIQIFWESITQSVAGFAHDWAIEAPDSIVASFRSEFDKSGKLTKEIGSILGKEYEESWEDFQQRIASENLLNALAHTEIGEGVSAMAEAYRTSAADLTDFTTFVLKAATDIRDGMGLLRDEGGLGDVVALIEELSSGGDTLTETYFNLSEASTYLRDILDDLNVVMFKSSKALVTFSAEFIEAAGGIENARNLFESFNNSYLTAEERNNSARSLLNENVIHQVEDLGAEGEGLSFENFRKRFTEMLPTLDAQQMKEWLEAGDALAELARALGRTEIAASDLKGTLAGYSDSLSSFQDMLNVTSSSATDYLGTTLNNILDIASSYDGSIQQEARLMGLLQSRYEQEIQYLGMIESIQRSLNATLDSSIEGIRMSQMSTQGQYEYLRQQANDLADSLVGMTDPEEINSTVNRINELQGRAWGLLTDDQRESMAAEFINFLEGIQDIANENLETARDTVGTQNQTISQAVEEALKGAGERLERAANRQAESTDRFSQAVDTFAETEVRVVLVDNRGQVGGLMR